MATKLRITSLKFISAVDAGAQGPIANVALVKRAPSGDEYVLTAKVAKLDEAIGVVFGYAVASTVDGGASPHIDFQGDAVVGGDELIKVALGFAEAGAQSDVMHDCVKDGWVPFVMPLNAETKKAFKLAGDVEGIAIGMKPSAETFKRFVSGELGAFSIYGTGERTPLEKAGVKKQSLYTTEVLGHQHTLDICGNDEYCVTSYQTAEGAEDSHSHRWVRGTDGTVMILADSGHTHDLAPDQAAVIVVPADAVVVVAARAPNAAASKSTLAPSSPHGDDMKLVVLTESQHAHYSKLAAADAEAFIAKTTAERDAIVKAAIDADPVVYKTTSGLEIRKSAGEVALQLAKQGDDQAKTIATQTAEIAKANAATEQVTLEKRATVELSHFGKTLGVKAAILKAVDGIADEAVRKEAHEALKGANAACVGTSTVKGSNDGGEPSSTSASALLKTAVEEYAKANNIEHYAVAFAKATASDPKVRELYAAAQAERN